VILKEATLYWITAEKIRLNINENYGANPGLRCGTKVMKDHAFQNISIRKKQTSFKQADIRTLFERTQEKKARILE
jgi:hypothetical protein